MTQATLDESSTYLYESIDLVDALLRPAETGPIPPLATAPIRSSSIDLLESMTRLDRRLHAHGAHQARLIEAVRCIRLDLDGPLAPSPALPHPESASQSQPLPQPLPEAQAQTPSPSVPGRPPQAVPPSPSVPASQPARLPVAPLDVPDRITKRDYNYFDDLNAALRAL